MVSHNERGEHEPLPIIWPNAGNATITPQVIRKQRRRRSDGTRLNRLINQVGHSRYTQAHLRSATESTTCFNNASTWADEQSSPPAHRLNEFSGIISRAVWSVFSVRSPPRPRRRASSPFCYCLGPAVFMLRCQGSYNCRFSISLTGSHCLPRDVLECTARPENRRRHRISRSRCF